MMFVGIDCEFDEFQLKICLIPHILWLLWNKLQTKDIFHSFGSSIVTKFIPRKNITAVLYNMTEVHLTVW